MRTGHRGPVGFSSKVDRRVLGEAGPVNFRVADSLAHCPAMDTVDEVGWSCQAAIDECGELDAKLGRENHLRNQESEDLAHPPALRDHGAEVFVVTWVGEHGSLGGLVNVEIISSVLSRPKGGDWEDWPRLSGKIGDKNLDYNLPQQAAGFHQRMKNRQGTQAHCKLEEIEPSEEIQNLEKQKERWTEEQKCRDSNRA